MSSQTQGTEPTELDAQPTTEAMKRRRKQLVRERDDHQCVNCRRGEDDVESLDAHHIVPLGQGGSWLVSNMVTLCRRCHDSIHKDRTAPTVRWCSTRNMTDDEFDGYNTLVQGLFPAFGEQINVIVDPMFNLHGRDEWHIPIAHVEQLKNATNNIHREG